MSLNIKNTNNTNNTNNTDNANNTDNTDNTDNTNDTNNTDNASNIDKTYSKSNYKNDKKYYYNENNENNESNYNDNSFKNNYYKSYNNNLNRQISDDTDNLTTITDWDQLDNINIPLLRGIYSHGFEKPSPIQSKAIKPMFDGKDLIAQAQSGTGKTGCFSIGTLQLINTSLNETQAMILSPTRELSQQTYRVIQSISSQIKNLTLQLLVGGTSTEKDMNNLINNVPHIIIGCPGRVHDMIKRRKLKTNKIKLLVLDEADEMLSKGFQEQIYNIFQFLPEFTQVALFSATIPIEVENLTSKFMNNPIKVLVKNEMLTLEGIQQYYVALQNDEQKFETLKDIFSSISLSQCIIYCNSTNRVQDVFEKMKNDDFPVCQIHGNMDKEERNNNFIKFYEGTCRVLISSNVTARGIDIQQVSTVINYDIPKCINIYLHRIGRSGRWGRKGISINFVTPYDVKKIQDIERFYNTQINELPADFSGI
tara:strand:- start:293 stop:1732 length:1440 start_codon:yes stop_codon:yes gene_type:complete